ncbi:hypothetical protein BDF20DRAFT_818683 [Mycotypha africana]|uniref:uncharacterized protein n=1 Tax=Mycotypha africana TaxID=64632 RepID=UPI002301A951|nr:uncharacterized protein BDF20DRAFT_818683 [Mycotypha africana]KAI8981874.1 hypothetical protein BDF20DRAFT_818683 [Mycotypha africana]
MLKSICKTSTVRSFFSTTAFTSSHRTAAIGHSSLFNAEPTHVFKPLQQFAPTFYARGEDIKPLYQPCVFYSQLKSNILSAKERVFIAALYIGQNEQDLVDTIRKALAKNPELNVHILIDCLRGTRMTKGGQSSATLLLPLIRDYPGRMRVSMYHTPDLTGLLKRTLPQRFNESIGLMHLKLYGVDNSIMLSGANLSSDYFTNRQDRYMLFHKQSELTDYYYNLLNLISNSTYDNSSNNGNSDAQYDTAILPVIQMGPFHIRQDERLTLELLNIANEQPYPWTIHLTSGYFNFTEKYKSFILRTKAKFRFLTAAPEANGFFNSKGVSRFLPPAYTHIERQFYRHIKRMGREEDITIEEYRRPGWTYHAKGLWVFLNSKNTSNDELPYATMIGSPNFGQRSMERDLEAQVLVITRNENLRKALYKEVDLLHQYSEVVSKETFDKIDRKVPNGVKIATSFIKTML